MNFKPSLSIGEQVYVYILEKIQQGEFQEGERLMEVSLADKLKVSRMPVREAFRRLEQDGILEKTPQRGTRVTQLKPETINEIFNIRRLLESYAVELACSNRDESHLSAMKNIEARAKEILSQKNITPGEKYKHLFSLNTQFHDLIWQASGSQYLMRLLNNMRHMVLRLRTMSLRQDAFWNEAWKEHGDLITLIEKRDTTQAIDKIRSHIDQAASHISHELKVRDGSYEKTG